MRSSQDTIAALVTPPGEGGVGVLRISGASALAVVQPLFHGRQPLDLTAVPSHSCHVGTIVADQPIDQVVVTVFRAPHSYTGEDVVEISAHGSPFILNQMLKACVTKGARLAGPGGMSEREVRCVR